METYQKLQAGIHHARIGVTSRVPERLKYELRRRLAHGETSGRQTNVTIDGTTGTFLIRNPSDKRRLVRDVEREFAGQLLACIDPSKKRFLDIGSAQGLYSILAAQKGAQVDAVDPDPVSYRSIRDNLTLNPDVAHSVHVLPIALGASRGRVKLHIDSHGSDAPSFAQTSEALTETRRVRMRTVDGLIARHKIASPTVVKIDVEGAEGLVLRGMTTLLQSKDRPRHLFLELHSPEFLEEFGTNQEEVLRQIHDMGYVAVEGDLISRDSEKQYHFVPATK